MKPKQYHKKPVVIEAMQFTKDQLPDIGHEIAKWCGGRLNIDAKASDPTDVLTWMEKNLYPPLVGDANHPETLKYHDQIEKDNSRPDKGWYISPKNGSLMIRTLEGDMRVSPGDYVIRGINGEFYPCKPYIFENSYEEVSIGESQNNPEQVLYSLPIEPEGSILDVNKTKWTRKFRFWESEEGNHLFWAELLSAYGPLSSVNND